MEDFERNLMISLCLGLRLQGIESREELETLLSETSDDADLTGVQQLQRDMAEWLGVSLDDHRNQQAASVALWENIESRGYGLVDVPVKIRRPGFGGSTEIQKRHASETRQGPLPGVLLKVVFVVVLAAIAWIAYQWMG